MKNQIDSQIINLVETFDYDYDLKTEFYFNKEVEKKFSKLLETHPSWPANLPLCRCLARICDVTNRWKKGLEYARNVFPEAKVFPETEEKLESLRTCEDATFLMRNFVRLYDEWGKLYYRMGFYGNACFLFKEAIKTSENINYECAMPDLHSNLLRAEYNEWKWCMGSDPKRKNQKLEDFDSRYKEHIEHFEGYPYELNKYELMEYERGLSSMCHNYAILLWYDMSKFDEGRKMHERVKKINEYLEDNYRLNQSLYNIGFSYFTQWSNAFKEGKKKEAEKWYHEADKYFDIIIDRKEYCPREEMWVHQKRAEYAYRHGNNKKGDKEIDQVENIHHQYGGDDLATKWWTYPMVLEYKPDDEEILAKFIDVGIELRNQLSYLYYRRRFMKDLAEALRKQAISKCRHYIQKSRPTEIDSAVEGINRAYNQELVDFILLRDEVLLPQLRKAEDEKPSLFEEVEEQLLKLRPFLNEQIEENKKIGMPISKFARILEEHPESEEYLNEAYREYEKIEEYPNLSRATPDIPRESIDYKELLDFDEAGIQFHLSNTDNIAFIITKAKGTILVQLDIDVDYLNTLSSSNLEPQEAYSLDIKNPTLRYMYPILFKPLEKHLNGIRRLYLLPSPIVTDNDTTEKNKPETRLITNLPLHATYDYESEQFLLEKFEIVNLLSPEALSIKKSRTAEAPTFKRMLIVGNPTEDLPDAQREAEDIAEMAKAVGLEVVLLDAKEANRKTVIDYLTKGGTKDGFTYIHFSAHGLIYKEQPLLASILLKDCDLITAADVLFKANLHGTRVVTLSTCKSGDAYSVEENENLGMARSFIASGADSVIAGMGEVDPEIARDFFGRFYESLLEDEENVVTAWQKACVGRLGQITSSDLKFPANWAPFVVYV